MYQVSFELLKSVCQGTKDEIINKYIEPLSQTCSHFEIDTNEKRLAAFIAQIAHESGGFIFVSENLNYSAERLTVVFKKYFPTLESAQAYHRRPSMIASKVYANRMGNGDEESGDGWKFKGRGLIQLTGKNNYESFAKSIGVDLDEAVEYLETPEGACASAGWFWDMRTLNRLADQGDFLRITKIINGGTHGLEDRIKRYEIALNFLKGI